MELIKLLERFVVAVETIAAKEDGGGCSCEGAETFETSKQEPEVSTEAYKETELDKMEHKHLKRLCEEAGIKVAKGTKRITLIRHLKRMALVEDEEAVETEVVEEEAVETEVVEEEAVETEVVEEEEENPFDTLEEEEDPLGGASEEEVKLTEEQVRAPLVEILGKEGKPPVAKILKEVGGVAKLDQLEEGNYLAVYEAANKYLKSIS